MSQKSSFKSYMIIGTSVNRNRRRRGFLARGAGFNLDAPGFNPAINVGFQFQCHHAI